MKTFVIASLLLLASIPLAVAAPSLPASSIPPPCGPVTCRPICLSCVISPCTVGTVTACVSYDSYTGCADVSVTLHSVSGVLVVATPGANENTPAINEGPVHVGSTPVTVDPVTWVYEPYSTPGRTVSDQLCSGPASGTLGQFLS